MKPAIIAHTTHKRLLRSRLDIFFPDKVSVKCSGPGWAGDGAELSPRENDPTWESGSVSGGNQRIMYQGNTSSRAESSPPRGFVQLLTAVGGHIPGQE